MAHCMVRTRESGWMYGCKASDRKNEEISLSSNRPKKEERYVVVVKYSEYLIRIIRGVA